jgi:hypothetical protein
MSLCRRRAQRQGIHRATFEPKFKSSQFFIAWSAPRWHRRSVRQGTCFDAIQVRNDEFVGIQIHAFRPQGTVRPLEFRVVTGSAPSTHKGVRHGGVAGCGSFANILLHGCFLDDGVAAGTQEQACDDDSRPHRQNHEGPPFRVRIVDCPHPSRAVTRR